MVRKKDPFWEHVETLANGRVRCRFCAEEFAGGSSRIKSHLSGKRGGGIKICPKVPRVVQSKVLQSIEAHNIEIEHVIGSDHNIKVENVDAHDTEVENGVVIHNIEVKEDQTISSSSPSSSKGLCSSSNPKVCKVKKDKGLVDKNLTKFIVADAKSWNAIISRFFIDFVKDVVNFGPHYELPDQTTFLEQLIPDLKGEVKEYYEDVMNSLPKSGCTMIFDRRQKWDGRNDRKRVYYRGLSAYTPKGVILFSCPPRQIQFSDVSLRAEFEYSELDWFQYISRHIDEIGGRHVIQFLTRGETIDSVRRSLTSRYPWMNVGPCPVEVIAKLLIYICCQLPSQYYTFACADVIAKFVHIHYPDVYFKQGWTRIKKPGVSSSNFLDNFADHYILHSAAKFWTLKSLLEFENKLQALQISTCDEDQDAKFVDCVIHCREFWTQAKELVSILQPLFQALSLTSLDGPSIGYLFQILEMAKAAISQCYDNNQVQYKKILELFDTARGEIIHPIHEAAAFLNPAYNCKANVMQGIIFISDFFVSLDEKEVFSIQLEAYYSKGSLMFAESAMKSLKSIHPRIWWDKYGNCLPVLQKYAVQILSQPCNSYCSNQPDFTLCTKVKMMERFKALEMQMPEAVDLDKLSGLEWVDQQEFEERLQHFEVGTADKNSYSVPRELFLFIEDQYKLVVV